MTSELGFPFSFCCCMTVMRRPGRFFLCLFHFFLADPCGCGMSWPLLRSESRTHEPRMFTLSPNDDVSYEIPPNYPVTCLRFQPQAEWRIRDNVDVNCWASPDTLSITFQAAANRARSESLTYVFVNKYGIWARRSMYFLMHDWLSPR